MSLENLSNMKVFVSWSGGKDCSYVRYLAEQSGLEVKYLLNMVSVDGKISWSHNMPAEILEAQSRAMGVPLIQHRTEQADYEAEFKKALRELKQQGVTGGVFGDIDIIMPTNVQVEVKANYIAGSSRIFGEHESGLFKNITYAAPAVSKKLPVVYLETSHIFGDIRIHN